MAEAPTRAGNRLALAGGTWYLLEIPLVFPFVSGTSPPVSKTAELVAYYSAHKANLLIGVAVGSVVWLGRIAFSAGHGPHSTAPRESAPLPILVWASWSSRS